MTDPVDMLCKLGRITPRDIGSYSTIRKSGMRFDIASYTLEGVGYFCTMKMSAFLGMMYMETLVLTPLEIDMPLLSYDAISAMGKDTLLLELYDTQIEPVDLSDMENIKKRYEHLADREKPEQWSDSLLMSPSVGKAGRKRDMKQDECTLTDEWIDAYIKIASTAKKCDREIKRAKVREYTDRLFTEGGPAVNQFKKMLGEQEAIRLLGQYIFSCDDLCQY